VGPFSYDVQVEDRKMKRHVDHILSAAIAPFPSTAMPDSEHSPQPKVAPKSPPPASASPEFRSAKSSPVGPAPENSRVEPIPFDLE
jgi:hypothetical protein